MSGDTVNFDDPESILRWLCWSGQLVMSNGRLRLWRRYRGSLYPARVVRQIYAAAESVGAEVVRA